MSRQLAKIELDMKYNKVIHSYKKYCDTYRIHCSLSNSNYLQYVQLCTYLLFDDVQLYNSLRTKYSKVYTNIVRFYPIFCASKAGDGVVLYTTDFKKIV